MKKIFKSLSFLLIIFVVFDIGSVFAQEQSVEFDVNSNIVKTAQDGYFYYDIDGWWNPSLAGNYYLILKYGNTKVDLCNFSVDPAPGSNMNFRYPSCNGMTTGYVVESGNSYSVYFSNSSKGEPISSCYSSGGYYCFLDSVPEDISAEEHDVLENFNVKLKEQSGEYYYDITADVIGGENGIVKIILWRTDGTGEIMHLNSAFNLSGNSTFSTSTKGRTPHIKSGEYKITINYEEDQQENPIQTYIIGSKVPSSGNTGGTATAGGNYSSGDSSGPLVTRECGYDGGRMCNFTDLMSMINRIINYIFVLVLPIAAIIFAYAGYLYIVSAGDPQKRTAAKNAMTKLVIGIVIIMMAWILVKTILVALGVKAGFSFLDMRG